MIQSINTPAICDTSHLSILKISGQDALSFLQGQFSNDVALLESGGTQLNSYNSPKGRMYAAFYLCRFDSDYFMVIPKEITDVVLKRLKMFIMRSNVQLENVSEQWKTLGVSGESIEGILEVANTKLPENIYQSDKLEKSHIINLSKNISRALFIGPESEIVDLRIKLSAEFPLTETTHWNRLDIHAGVPSIYANTVESFVAQMINFQLIDGVSFTKGCYPGQEVVARMHYLGKLKKRMYRISLEGSALPNDKIFNSTGENEQSVGQIVDAQENENGGYDALAVIQVGAVESNLLKLGSLDGESVSIETLPYAFPSE